MRLTLEDKKRDRERERRLIGWDANTKLPAEQPTVGMSLWILELQLASLCLTHI